jgi:hypothetical protein
LWARSLARIKASASGAENPGFKSQRARQPFLRYGLFFLVLEEESPALAHLLPAGFVVLCFLGLTFEVGC